MSSRAAGVAAVLALAALLLTGSASGSSAPWTRDLALINRGIDRAAAAGRIDSTEAGDYRGAANGAAGVLPKLRSSRYRNLAAVVHPVAGFWKGYDPPRGGVAHQGAVFWRGSAPPGGRPLFDMLAFNTGWFASHWDRKAGTDVV